MRHYLFHQYELLKTTALYSQLKTPEIMNFSEKLSTMERLHCLIRRKGTGRPKELARRLNISERCLYHLLNEMKAMGAPIYYNKSRRSYCYEYEIEFEGRLFKKP